MVMMIDVMMVVMMMVVMMLVMVTFELLFPFLLGENPRRSHSCRLTQSGEPAFE